MIDLFDELLAICLDRLADGDTVADCVMDFPEVPDLGPMLETAAALMALGAERPSRSWVPAADERPLGRGRRAGDVRLPWVDSGAA